MCARTQCHFKLSIRTTSCVPLVLLALLPLLTLELQLNHLNEEEESENIDNKVHEKKKLVFDHLGSDLEPRSNDFNFVPYVDTPARIIIAPSNTTVMEGHQALFLCRAQGHPKPNLRFEFNKKPVTETPKSSLILTRQNMGAVLFVKATADMDLAEIECFADNSVSTTSAGAFLRVIRAHENVPPGFPKLITPLNSHILETGRNAILVCEFEGDQPLQLGWIRDKHELAVDDVRLKLKPSGSLEILSVMQEDGGHYQCYARNEKGMVVSSPEQIAVRPITSPPVFTANTLDNVEMPKSVSIVNLTCEAYGYPPPETWWETTKERPLTARKKIISVLSLTDLSDTSSYVCKAQNKLGLVHRTVKVHVKHLPQSPTELGVRDLGPTFAYLRWRTSKSQGIDSYTLSIVPKGDTDIKKKRQIPNITPPSASLMLPEEAVVWVAHNVTELEPYKTYIASVVAIGPLGSSLASKSIEFTTNELPPDNPPKSVYANVSSLNSVIVSWKPPERTNGQITGYKVYYCQHVNWPIERWDGKATSNQESLEIGSLTANATYFIKVQAENSAGKSPLSEPFPIIIRPGVPPAPSNFRGVPTLDGGVFLHWERPDIGEGIVLEGYILQYKEDPEDYFQAPTKKLLPPDANNITLRGLQPNVEYVFYLQGVSKHGLGVLAQKTVKTEANELPTPYGGKITALDNAEIQIEWYFPEYVSPSMITKYRISWQKLSSAELDSVDVHVSSLSWEPFHSNQRLWRYVITSLSPRTQYRVNISSVSNRGSRAGPPYTYPPVMTKGRVPGKPVQLTTRSVEYVLLSSDNGNGNGAIRQYVKIHLEWERPAEAHGSLLLYELRFVPRPLSVEGFPDENGRARFKRRRRRRRRRRNANLLFDQYMDGQSMGVIRHNVTTNQYVTTKSDEIAFWRTYDIFVRALNEEGFGEAANTSVATPEGRPGAMNQIQVAQLSPTAVSLSWSPPLPEHCNGRIIKYEVAYCVRALGSSETFLNKQERLDSSNGDVFGSYSGQYNEDGGMICETLESINTTDTHLTKADLLQGRRYLFRVRAYTSVGPGEFTAWAHIPSGSDNPEPPQNIRVDRLNENQMKVTWRLPKVSSAQIMTGFRVSYSSKDQMNPEQWSQKDVGPVPYALISNLQGDLQYAVRVLTKVASLYLDPSGATKPHFSSWSEVVVPSTVKIPTVSKNSVNQLRCHAVLSNPVMLVVNWRPPTDDTNLDTFMLQVNGSKTYFSDTRKLQQQEHYSTQMKPDYDSQVRKHEIVLKNGIEPNTIYEVSLKTVYRIVDAEFIKSPIQEDEGQRTSCRTPIQRPESVKPPDVVYVDKKSVTVTMRVQPASEKMGPIEWYYLTMSSTRESKIQMPPTDLDLEKVIQEYNDQRSEDKLMVVAKWSSAFFDRGVSRENTADLKLSGASSTRRQKSEVLINGLVMLADQPLVSKQNYQAFVSACTFQEDMSEWLGLDENSFQSSPYLTPAQSGSNDRRSLCTHSPWSTVFSTEHSEFSLKPGGQDAQSGNGFITFVIVAVVLALAFTAVICIGFGCYSRRRKENTSHKALCFDNSLKQPLMAPKTNSGTVTTNLNANSHATPPASSIVTPSVVPPVTLNGSITSVANPLTASPTRFSNGAINSNSRTGTLANSEESNHKINSILTMGTTTNPMANLELQPLNHQRPSQPLPVNSQTISVRGFHTNGHASNSVGVASLSPNAVHLHHLAEHITDLRANDNLKFSQEYENIDPGQEFTWENSSLDVNKPKNRYANVIAYDHSRVILSTLPDIPHSDYINASWMDGYRRSRGYIAAQGPLVETMGDFWRLVWENQCWALVMMTRLEERSRVKCDQYWPSKGTETYPCGSVCLTGYHQSNMGGAFSGLAMQVTLLETTELAYYTIRRFRLRLCGASHGAQLSRDVQHYQFTAWPDHGVPESPLPLLQFMRRVRSDMRMFYQQQQQQQQQQHLPQSTSHRLSYTSSPLLVHCSAGVGRTGAYIVIDNQLDRVEHGEDTVDIFGTVTNMRAQRNYIVQTEEQYIFIHDVILEAVLHGNTEVPAHLLAQHLAKINQFDHDLGCTPLELEFKKVAAYRLSNGRHSSSHLPVNRLKNRLMNVLPYENTRVCLQSVRGLDGSDYINASHIDSFSKRGAYIAAQGPLPETTEDFWRMLWEHESTIVVMLTELREMGKDKCHPYWPSERSARYQYFVVDPMVEYNMPTYVLREFKVTDARDGQSRTLRQFQFTHWPTLSALQNDQQMMRLRGLNSATEPLLAHEIVNPNLLAYADALVDFISQVHKTKEQFGQEGPITVHCSAGVGRTGVFLAISVAMERLRYESIVDMYQTVRMLRTLRPSMVQSEEQYRLCYTGVQQYLSSFEHYPA